MPIHVEEMQTEVTVFDGDLPLSAAQLERLVELIAARLAERERGRGKDRRIPRRSIIPPLETRG
jgi:hypothetical protein